MAELDGVWEVRRISGALPPLLAVRKEIAGAAGSTKIGPFPGAPFDVVGRSLHYRAPFHGFVDKIDGEGDRVHGRATFRGREFGRFEMRRPRGGSMPSNDLEQQLVKHIDEAYAMEQNVLRMLDGMIENTEDEEIKSELREHKLETERHADRMQQRLEAHGATPSTVKEAAGIAGALMKSIVDMARPEKAGRNARDGYTTEHMEIAAYQLLERVARRAGDEETAAAARENRTEEEAMAKRLDAHWDKFAELSLHEGGVPV